ncbi:MAG: cell surface protein SprA, partial [Saprospiraceae bacterium]
YLSLQTLFNRNIDSLFKEFEKNRETISKRYAAQYGITNPSPVNPNYIDGFNNDHQDVILNSFLTTYSGKNPNNSKLDLFKTMPLPNWQLNYSGLSKLAVFNGFFQDFSIRHGYKTVLTVNSFRTNLDYEENLIGTPIKRKVDTLPTSYYTKYEIPGVVIDERFNPLIGINIKTKNGLDLSFDVNKTRMLTMQSSLGTLDERNSTEYVVRAAYVVKNVYLSFLPGMKKIKKVSKKFKKGQSPEELKAKTPKGNDINISLDFGIKDRISKLHVIDDNTVARPYEGAKVITLSPAVKYNLNKNLNLRLFVDYTKQIPYVSTAFKDVRINGGLTVQFLLN